MSLHYQIFIFILKLRFFSQKAVMHNKLAWINWTVILQICHHSQNHQKIFTGCSLNFKNRFVFNNLWCCLEIKISQTSRSGLLGYNFECFKTHVFTFTFWYICIYDCCLVCRHLVRLFALALRKYPKLQPCTSHSLNFHFFSLFSESNRVGQGLIHSRTHFLQDIC